MEVVLSIYLVARLYFALSHLSLKVAARRPSSTRTVHLPPSFPWEIGLNTLQKVKNGS